MGTEGDEAGGLDHDVNPTNQRPLGIRLQPRRHLSSPLHQPSTASPEHLGKGDGEVLCTIWASAEPSREGVKKAGSRGGTLWWLGSFNISFSEAER